MPKKSSPQPENLVQESVFNVKRIPQGTKLQWVASSLDAGDKEWLRNNANHSLEYVGEFLEDLSPSFTLSVKPEDRSGRYLATLVCTDKEHDGAGCALSSRGSTSFNALYALAYLALGKWPEPWWQQAGNDLDDLWG